MALGLFPAASAAGDIIANRPAKFRLSTRFGLMRRYEFEKRHDTNAIRHVASVQHRTLPKLKKDSRELRMKALQMLAGLLIR
jgi:hypothetical protein